MPLTFTALITRAKYADFNQEEDEEDPEKDPANHLVDGGDNDDNESSNDDDDDDVLTRGKILAELHYRAREKKHSGESKPLYSKCNYHHDVLCAPKCHKCNRVGHLAHDYRSSTNANTANNPNGNSGQVRRLLAMNVGIKVTTGMIT
ncbi:hypothetical protein Tco_0421558 [Tanacetum coccineum]